MGRGYVAFAFFASGFFEDFHTPWRQQESGSVSTSRRLYLCIRQEGAGAMDVLGQVRSPTWCEY